MELKCIVILVASMAIQAIAGLSPDAAPALVPAPREQVWREGTCRFREQDIRFVRDAALPPEGYRLVIAPDGVSVASADDAGAFYAVQTLRQAATERKGDMLLCQCGTVTDAPRFRWRGVMLDEARHFLGKEVVMRLIDQIASYKFNVFHWHLTDDQGWRVESKRHPELTAYGAVRPKSVMFGTTVSYHPVTHKGTYQYNTEKYGPFFYTQDDIREVLAHAAARHVRVVPEIESPGHVRALLAAHPEFGCRGAELERVPRCAWSIEEDVLCAGNDEALAFVEDVLDEMRELFGADILHIGGDECPKVRWKACPKCRARIEKERLGDEKGLQAWIATQLTRHLEAHGCRVVGWDEILNGNVPKSAIGMCWRQSARGGAGDDLVTPKEAARRGHDVIVALTTLCYLSRSQGIPDDPFPYTTYRNPLSLEKAYSFNPLDGLDENEAKHVIGVQACMWSESLFNVFDLDWKMWPRAMAIAEIAWSNPKERDFAAFRARAAAQRKRLVSAHVNCAPVN